MIIHNYLFHNLNIFNLFELGNQLKFCSKQNYNKNSRYAGFHFNHPKTVCFYSTPYHRRSNFFKVSDTKHAQCFKSLFINTNTEYDLKKNSTSMFTRVPEVEGVQQMYSTEKSSLYVR